MLDKIATLVPDRADRNGGPEHAGILAAIADFQTTLGITLERRFDVRQRLSVGTAGHQEIEALSQHLFPEYPVSWRKASLAKIIGSPPAFASVNNIAMRVVSAATTKGPDLAESCRHLLRQLFGRRT